MADTERLEPKIYMEQYNVKEDPHDYGLGDAPFDLETFKQKLKIVIVRYEGDDLEFDLIGIHPSLANAFRRLMISEVPSMAIEKVYIYNNTSILQDEVLAHRLGLIPLRADPRLFSYPSNEEDCEDDMNSLEYELKVRCTRNKDVKDSAIEEEIYKNSSVLTSQIKWLPTGKQDEVFQEADVGCVHDDILICKLRPGHEIDLRMVAVKGIGKDHAKFSPVSTAYYRLLPKVRLLRPFYKKDAVALQECFSPGVIEIDESDKAYVKDARYDTCSRNVYRYPDIAAAVEMSRVRDHFIFTVESVGGMKPHVIFLEAVKILKAKCRKFRADIEKA